MMLVSAAGTSFCARGPGALPFDCWDFIGGRLMPANKASKRNVASGVQPTKFEPVLEAAQNIQRQFDFAGAAAFLYVAPAMFETIYSRIEAVEQKLKHLRRFL